MAYVTALFLARLTQGQLFIDEQISSHSLIASSDFCALQIYGGRSRARQGAAHAPIIHSHFLPRSHYAACRKYRLVPFFNDFSTTLDEHY